MDSFQSLQFYAQVFHYNLDCVDDACEAYESHEGKKEAHTSDPHDYHFFSLIMTLKKHLDAAFVQYAAEAQEKLKPILEAHEQARKQAEYEAKAAAKKNDAERKKKEAEQAKQNQQAAEAKARRNEARRQRRAARRQNQSQAAPTEQPAPTEQAQADQPQPEQQAEQDA